MEGPKNKNGRLAPAHGPATGDIMSLFWEPYFFGQA